MRTASYLRGVTVAALTLLNFGVAGAAPLSAPEIESRLELFGSISLGVSVRITLLVLVLQQIIRAAEHIQLNEDVPRGVGSTVVAYALLYFFNLLG